MDNSLTAIIDSATSILVLLPAKPSFDQVSAGLSFYLSLMGVKQATISCPSPMMVGFNRIIGINKISSEVGNKNLTIKFKDYDAANIEKVSYDIIDNEFNLTVVPKLGFTSPKEDQVNVGFSGLSADLIVLIGGQGDIDFPILTSKELTVSKIVHIGTRPYGGGDREVLSFARPGSSVSELVVGLIKDTAGAMDPDIATNLVMGIEEGSRNFSSSEVTPDTFETFAFLLRNGGRRQSRIKLSPVGFPPGSIPTQPLNIPVQKTPVNPDPVLEQVETKEEVTIENAPDDWLQPKVFKNSINPPQGQSDSFSENKG